MEKHSNDRKPHADRGKADLSKKVERKEASASRRIHTSAEPKTTETTNRQAVKNNASVIRASKTQGSSKGKVDLSKNTENKTANHKTVEINAAMRKSNGKVNLSKETESESRSVFGTIHTYSHSRPIGINAPTPKHKRELAKKTVSKGGRIAESAANTVDKLENGTINAVTSSADKSSVAGAVILQGANLYQAVNNAKRKVISTAIKFAPKIVKKAVKLPSKIKYIRMVGMGKVFKLAARKKFKLHNIIKLTKRGVGGTVRLGANLTSKSATALQNALSSSDTAGAAAISTAIQGGRALATGAKVGGKAVKTGAKVVGKTAKITVKTTRKIATKIERKIANGTAKRALKTSVQAVKASQKAAKATVKTAQVTAKATAKIAQALSAAAAKFVSLIMSTAPFSFVVIGVIIIIIIGGGFFMSVCNT